MNEREYSKQKTSAGLLMFRYEAGRLEVLLAHPGGPYFAKKDAGAWTLPKGLVDSHEAPLSAARREFEEETGFDAPAEGYLELGEIRQKSGKLVLGWAFEGNGDPAEFRSNTFEMEWPPRSGRTASFPEIDRIEWVTPEVAARKLNPAQASLVENLLRALGSG